jgi:Flp pilus assembly protein protease CpaA
MPPRRLNRRRRGAGDRATGGAGNTIGRRSERPLLPGQGGRHWPKAGGNSVSWPITWLDAISPLQGGVLFFACLVAAITDISAHRIPNVLTLPVLAAGLAWAAWQRGAIGFLEALAAAFLLALPYLLLFVYARGGGGDVKLMAGVGAWAGLGWGLVVLLLVAVSGVVMGLTVALARKQCQAVVGRVSAVVCQVLPAIAGRSPKAVAGAFSPVQGQESQPMPYGVAIFAGVCLAIGGSLLWHV